MVITMPAMATVIIEYKEKKPLNLSLCKHKQLKKEWWTCQNTLTLMGFFGVLLCFVMRLNLGVAIISMVKNNQTVENNSDSTTLHQNSTINQTQGEFDWSMKDRSFLLGSYFIGYTISNFVGGVIVERKGGTLVLGLGLFISSILTLATPIAARLSLHLFMVLRIFMGISQGAMFPSLSSLLAAWVLPEDRALITGIVFGGGSIGTVVCMISTGMICHSPNLGGWQTVFYVNGTLALIWSAGWFYLIKDSPMKHPNITNWEKKKLEPICLYDSGTKDVKIIPWKKIFCSVVFWSILVMHFGSNWLTYTIVIVIPTYLSEIQNMNLTENGLASGIPNLATWISAIIISKITTMLLKRNKITLVNVRRLGMVIGGYLAAICLVGLCFVENDPLSSTIILCLLGALTGGIFSGFFCSHMDIAPRYAGVLLGITNSVGSVPGFLSPVVTGIITNDNQTNAAWCQVFIISSVIAVVTTTVYLVTVKADVQDWNFHGLELPKSKKITDGES